MTETVFPPVITTVPIVGTDHVFPIRRVFCVGQNYTEHSIEMGGDPDRELPFFFSKPPDAVVPSGTQIPYPPATENLHHEAELVVAIGTGGADISVDNTMGHIFGYAAGNDLTRRDIQAAAKVVGRPWDMAKGFDNSAVIAPIHRVADVGHLTKGAITAHVDGVEKQTGDLSNMIWKLPEIISYLSSLVTLEPGDLILTGTPAGVGPLERGQTCVVSIAGLTDSLVTLTD